MSAAHAWLGRSIYLREQVGIDLVGVIGQARARLAIDRLDTHAAHERGNVTATYRMALVLKQAGELARAQERML